MNNSLPDTTTTQAKRAFWLRHLHQWHWISSAMCLIAMMLFAITGITLNHSAQVEAHAVVTQKNGTLPADVMHDLRSAQSEESSTLPDAARVWLKNTLAIEVNQQAPEWSPEEVYVPLPRPGGDAWLRIDMQSGALEYELTDRGWISYFNDLHKGRNAGTTWPWFLDLFAAACLVFCITGLLLLKMHAANRPSTWPFVVTGLVLPLLIAVLFIH